MIFRELLDSSGENQPDIGGAHAVLLVDQAGWHLPPKREVPDNISIVAIPSKSPELNP